MVRRIVHLVLPFALSLLATAVHAQTYTQKPGEFGCRVATFECQLVPMTSGDKYTINEPYNQLYPGTQFIWGTTQGAVTAVIQQLPAIWAPGVYTVAYDVELSTGKQGTVTCTVTIGRVGRWPYASVSGTTIVFH